MTHELVWHGPVEGEHYRVEADTEDEAAELCEAPCEDDQEWLSAHRLEDAD